MILISSKSGSIQHFTRAEHTLFSVRNRVTQKQTEPVGVTDLVMAIKQPWTNNISHIQSLMKVKIQSLLYKLNIVIRIFFFKSDLDFKQNLGFKDQVSKQKIKSVSVECHLVTAIKWCCLNMKLHNFLETFLDFKWTTVLEVQLISSSHERFLGWNLWVQCGTVITSV